MPASAPNRKSWLKRLVPELGIELVGPETLVELRQLLDKIGLCSVLVIGCGRRRDKTAPHFLPHECIFTDVDPSADVDIFCDGHDLPFQDQTFDAVIIHAVLEHVLDPVRVVSEIHRVLKPEGLVYSAVPFMQQVHEQAYDFTRYTLSGHRRLFRYFNELRSGMVAGPGTALAWALEFFALSFCSRKYTRWAAIACIRIGFFWLKYCDYLCVHRPEAMDAASGTYFIGTKKEEATPDIDFIRSYIGTKNRNIKREKMMRTS
jgi:SAM-dependent methyltransferase